jgi:beclin 1
MSFIMLTDSQVSSPPTPPPKTTRKTEPAAKEPTAPAAKPLGDALSSAEHIFEVLSARSDIDHPLCLECADLLVDGLQRRLNRAVRERDAYVEFLRQANADVPSPEDVARAERELAEAADDECKALEELERLELDRAALEEELLALDGERRAQAADEAERWAARNAHADAMARHVAERDALAARAAHDARRLRRLQRANVYNDAFAIGYDGFFGTINGLRLGRLPAARGRAGAARAPPVEWAEINAAWGHALLLLDTVARRLDYRFRGYRLCPMGSTSKIVEILSPSASASRRHGHGSGGGGQRTRVHELYSSGEFAMSVALFGGRFDGAMIVFLECLRQLVVHAQTTIVMGIDGKPVVCPKIPYDIERDRIGGNSIRLAGFGQEEQWTKACKSTLICCKYLLAHASNVNELGRRGGDDN